MKNKIVLVTGASSGIGEAVSREAARRGAKVLLSARRLEELNRVAKEVPNSVVCAVDLSNLDSVDQWRRKIHALGIPDYVINCAGSGRFLAVEETSPSDFIGLATSPFLTSFFSNQAFLAEMLRRGSGVVVNVNSPASFIPIPGAAGYTAARFALRGLTRTLCAEVRSRGVRVIHFVVGTVETPYFTNNPLSKERIPGINAVIPRIKASTCAQHICNSAQFRSGEVFFPFQLRALHLLYRYLPSVVDFLIQATGWNAQRSLKS